VPLDVLAADLGRSEMTVRTHLRSARAKLEIRTTAELRDRLVAGEFDVSLAEE
jgi:DNA-binding CsgD family transcriptional regulator